MANSAITGPLLSDVSRSADGSEAAPSWSFQNSPTTGFYRVSSNVLGLSTAGLQRMVVDASGNVGIGTGSPASKLEVNGSIRIPANAGFQLGNGSTYFYTTATSNGDFVFGTSSAERMRIDASGNVGIGTTPAGTVALDIKEPDAGQDLILGLTAGTGARAQIRSIAQVDNTSSVLTFSTVSGSATNERMRIHANGGVSLVTGLTIGAIAFNPSSTFLIGGNVLSSGSGTHFLKWNNVSGLVTYDSSSRLVKENIINSPYGLDEILALKPRKYYRIDDDREEIGFVADEVVDVLPEFVHVVKKSILTKDENDTELVPGSINYDKLTAVLVKAIQELSAKVDAQAAEIEALKAQS